MTGSLRMVARHDGAGPDAALLAAMQGTAAGDRQAFERLYRLTSGKLLSVSRRILRDVHDAEEALQNAYINVWRSAGAYDPARGRPMTWLITVAHRCAIDVLRRRRAAAEPDAQAIAPEAAFEDAPGAADGQLAHCLRGLEQRDEVLLRAAFFEGFTYAELATRSATPLGTIKSRARRALLKLAECLR